MPEKKVAIIGATGFTGSELVRLLYHHPGVEIAFITSESKAGDSIADIYPSLVQIIEHKLIKSEELPAAEIDLAFLALPHGVSMDYVAKFASSDFPIIDLSGDFRLNDAATYEAWYGKEHSYPHGFGSAVYGIPELYADKIRTTKLIANPGCYPTSILLGAAPLVKGGIVDPSTIIADSKSGVTGAGVASKPVNHFSNVHDNFKAYGVKTHRHSIEIQENLTRLAGREATVQFTPHLLPVDRGILSTIYAKPAVDGLSDTRLRKIFEGFYAEAPFIRILDTPPSIKYVRGTNYCDIMATYDERTGNIIILSAIDNLVKGAAGQAIQNMNLLFGWEEQAGLQQLPLFP